jgi:hypothetical protein
LCVDRIYNENLDESDRVPACVKACPTGARHFGDLGDANSAVSQLVAQRGGYDLMSDMGYKPTNKYLPPRARRDTATFAEAMPKSDGSAMEKLFAWADKLLSKQAAASASQSGDHPERLEG